LSFFYLLITYFAVLFSVSLSVVVIHYFFFVYLHYYQSQEKTFYVLLSVESVTGATRADYERDAVDPDQRSDDADLDGTGDRLDDAGPGPVRTDDQPAAASTVDTPAAASSVDTRAAASAVDTPAAGSTVESTTGPLLGSADTEGFRSRWTGVQTGFVDAPREAVQKADALVAELMQHLAGKFADERSKLEKQWDRGDDVPTDDLRDAFQHYRSFFERLLSA